MGEVERLSQFDDIRIPKVSNVTSESVSDNKRTYDTAFKNFFKRKEVLAIIIKEIVPEFKNVMPNEIEKYIVESTVNKLNAETLSEEDTTFSSKILYDVIIKCKLPVTNTSINMCIIFDLEMQRQYAMKYDIIDRAIYYASRLLAKQSVKGSKYEELVPVYSTWICLKGIPDEQKNTVHSFRLLDNNEVPIDSKRSLLNVDLLLLSEEYNWDTEDDTVIKFLQAVFKNRLYDQDFNPYLKVDAEISKEVQAIMKENEQFLAEMDYIREVTEEKALKKGMEKGIEKGRVNGIISTALSLGVTDSNKIADLLVDQLKITKAEALCKIEAYQESERMRE